MSTKKLILMMCVIFFANSFLKASGESEVVAYVNNRIITQQDLSDELKSGRWYQVNQKLETDFQGAALIKRRYNLTYKVLGEMIMDQLINDEGKKLIPTIPKSMIDEEITKRIKVFRLETKEELKVQIRTQGITWKEFLENLEMRIRVSHYKSSKIRSRIRISPKHIHNYYELHKDDHKVLTHTSEIGEKSALILFHPEKAKIRLLTIMPKLKDVKIKDLNDKKVKARHLSDSFGQLKDKSLESIKKWLDASQQLEEKMIIDLKIREVPRKGYIHEKLAEFAFNPEKKGQWSKAIKTSVSTNLAEHPSERWDRIQLIEITPIRQRPFSECRQEILTFLEDAKFDREMEILREELFRRGGVNIVMKAPE
jgi:hypothetical protein